MRNEKTRKIVTISMFTAIIVVLQLVATFVRFGAFPITLTLVPIIIAGAVYGLGMGSLMGLVFGLIVALMVVTGLDPSGATMLNMHPFITIGVCIVKGVLAGLASAAVFKAVSPKNKILALILAAATAPIVNTGIFYITLILFFEATFAAMFSAFISINFIIELLINMLLAPSLIRLLKLRTIEK